MRSERTGVSVAVSTLCYKFWSARTIFFSDHRILIIQDAPDVLQSGVFFSRLCIAEGSSGKAEDAPRSLQQAGSRMECRSYHWRIV